MQDPVLMYRPGDPAGSTTYVEREAYRNEHYAKGWRSDDDPLYAGQNPVIPSPIPTSTEDLAYQPAISRWRQKLAVARAGGLSVQLICLGDSMLEGYTSTRYRNRALDQIRRRINGARPASLGYLPASANIASSLLDADWAGGDSPWVFTGGTGSLSYGPGFHAASITSGTATLTYFGDVINLFYVRTSTGPSAAGVTLDGVAQTALNANGAALPGQVASYGTPGSYGFHTLVVTVSTGTLVIEGAWWFDGEFNGFFANGTCVMVDATHAGFGAQNWAGVNNDWSAMLSGTDSYNGLVLIALGRNDAFLDRTPAQFENDLVTITSRIDARVSGSVNYLFVILPGDESMLDYINAAWRAAALTGIDRAAVLDLGQLRTSRAWGADLEDDGVHPNDAGQTWIADALLAVLDPTPQSIVPVTPERYVIDATTIPTFRSSWTAAVSAIAGSAHLYDEATASALREKRYRRWHDAGTYQAVITAEHATGRGILEVLIGRYNGATAELVSCGTVDTSTPAGPALTTTVLSTTVVSHVPGFVPVVVRKTNQANVGRPVQVVINKIA